MVIKTSTHQSLTEMTLCVSLNAHIKCYLSQWQEGSNMTCGGEPLLHSCNVNRMATPFLQLGWTQQGADEHRGTFLSCGGEGLKVDAGVWWGWDR